MSRPWRTESDLCLLRIICIGGDPLSFSLVQEAIPKDPHAAKLLVLFAKDRPVVPILIDGLSQKENPLLRTACAYGLGELCEKSAVPQLVKLATEPNTDTGIAPVAVRALAKILSGGRIREEVDTSPPSAKFIRMSRNVPIDIPEAFEAIIRSLEVNKGAKQDVIAVLGAIGGERACSELVKIMKNEANNVFTRGECALQLGRIGSAAAHGALLEVLPRSKGQERVKICVALGRIADESDRTTLQEIADKDEDATVREAAKAAIEDMGFRQELRKKREEGK
jgi:HEAT repeat protein